MSRKLLDELIESKSRINESVIKTRADHIINSGINLLDEIEEKYGEDIAKLLEKRLVASIKSRSPNRFKFPRTQ